MASTATLGERIRFAREARRLTQDDVASHFSISRVSVTQWEADRTRPDVRKLGSLAEFLGTSVEWLVESKGHPPVARPASPRVRNREVGPQLIAGSELVGAKDLPVYAAAMGGNGHTIVTFDAIDYMKRPEVLQSVKGGYGILIVGDSMVPAYWPGDTALVHPHLPPSRDTDSVFYHTPPAGDAEAIVKRLVGMNDRTWTLEQYKPALVFDEPRVEWPICHRIVGRYNAR